MLLVHDLPVKLYSPSNFNSEFHPSSSEDIRLYGLGRFPIARFLTAVTATAERERCVGRPAGPPSPPRRRRLRFCALCLPACLPPLVFCAPGVARPPGSLFRVWLPGVQRLLYEAIYGETAADGRTDGGRSGAARRHRRWRWRERGRRRRGYSDGKSPRLGPRKCEHAGDIFTRVKVVMAILNKTHLKIMCLTTCTSSKVRSQFRTLSLPVLRFAETSVNANCE